MAREYKRKPISQKTRFEVFKRDNFTCQYCGCKAPDVVLEIDHIEPVSKGGTNEIINLITSCFDCNRGKSNKRLGDKAVIEQQQEELEVLNERRKQLEMMVKWRKELMKIDSECTDVVVEAIEHISGFGVNDKGRQNVVKWVKQFDLEILLDSVEAAFSQYDEWEKSFCMIPRIASVKSDPETEIIQKIYYIRGIINSKINGGLESYEKAECKQMITYISQGFDLDELQAGVKQSGFHTWEQAKSYLQEWMPSWE